MKPTPREDVLRTAVRIATRYEEMKAKFVLDVAKNPSYALRWASGFADETARAEAWASVAAYLEKPEVTLEEVRGLFLQRILCAYPEQSTSMFANYMATAAQHMDREVFKALDSAISYG